MTSVCDTKIILWVGVIAELVFLIPLRYKLLGAENAIGLLLRRKKIINEFKYRAQVFTELH